jgi:hypothetical protein
MIYDRKTLFGSGPKLTADQLITVDAVYVANQNKIARFIISLDRGRNERDIDGYKQITEAHFINNRFIVRHQQFIPYTSLII